MSDKFLNIENFETYLNYLNEQLNSVMANENHNHSEMEDYIDNLENTVNSLQQTINALKR